MVGKNLFNICQVWSGGHAPLLDSEAHWSESQFQACSEEVGLCDKVEMGETHILISLSQFQQLDVHGEHGRVTHGWSCSCSAPVGVVDSLVLLMVMVLTLEWLPSVWSLCSVI